MKLLFHVSYRQEGHPNDDHFYKHIFLVCLKSFLLLYQGILFKAVWFLIAAFSSSRVPDFSFYTFWIRVTPQEEITHRQVEWAQDHRIVISLNSPHLLLWVEQKKVFEKDKKCAFVKMAVIWVI